MSKRYLPIAVVTAALAVVALIGYMWPASEPLLPVTPLPDRVLLDNSAGKVVFDHKKHFEEYKVECQACHHERDKPSPIVQPCGSCHGAAENENFRTEHLVTFTDQVSCTTCHHVEFGGTNQSWNHAEHQKMLQENCGACHHTDERSRPEQQKCSNCHALFAEGNKPAVQDAVHSRCAAVGCHGDLFPEDSMKECQSCHNLIDTKTTLRAKGWISINPDYANCTVCHADQAIDDLIPSRMQAFHDSCMGCHEKLEKGPYGQETCNQCHTK